VICKCNGELTDNKASDKWVPRLSFFIKEFCRLLRILLSPFAGLGRLDFSMIFVHLSMKMSTPTIKGQLYVFLLFSSAIWLGGCINLKAVRDFSTAAMTNVQNFKEIDYTFLDHCTDRCEDEAIRKFEFQRALECSCDLYVRADSVTQAMYQTVGAYFEGLGSLSQNELTEYSTDALMGSLTAEELGPLKIDENLSTAYATISNIMLRATTDFYRRRKISAYIEEANQPLQVMLAGLQGIVSTNLNGELRFKRERMYAYYMDMKMNSTLQSEYEKGRAASGYYQALKKIQQKERQMDLLVAGLAKIASGHQLLYDNRDKLSVKDLTLSMLSYSAQVKILVSEFNKLNQ
jgi:hypothetical protein